MTNRKKLNGNRNQCPTCGQYFNSNGVDRRCMVTSEMLEEGMILGEDEFWRGSAMPEGLHS